MCTLSSTLELKPVMATASATQLPDRATNVVRTTATTIALRKPPLFIVSEPATDFTTKSGRLRRSDCMRLSTVQMYLRRRTVCCRTSSACQRWSEVRHVTWRNTKYCFLEMSAFPATRLPRCKCPARRFVTSLDKKISE